MSNPITCGKWTAQIAGRGGSPIRVEPPFRSMSRKKTLNTYGGASIDLGVTGAATSVCCEVFTSSEPWRDELVLYRDDEFDYAGPIINQTVSNDGGSVESSDLFIWLDNRFLEEDFYGSGDLADIFKSAFHAGYDKDNSPNIELTTRHCGVDGLRSVKGSEFRRAADVMRELARTGLDFTVIGRRIVAGGAEVFIDSTPLLLHDQACLRTEVTRPGAIFATDVAIFGGTASDAGSDTRRLVSVSGRAVRSEERYGLVQKSYTELLIKDGISADANALARLDALQPIPLQVSATLGPDCAFGFADLIPGKRVDVRLAQAAGCIEVMQEMRLVEVTVSVGEDGAEKVDINLVPLGVVDG